jgi:hypothetical protein
VNGDPRRHSPLPERRAAKEARFFRGGPLSKIFLGRKKSVSFVAIREHRDLLGIQGCQMAHLQTEIPDLGKI